VWRLASVDQELAVALDESRPVGFELSPDGTLLFYSSNADLLVANVSTQEILFRTRIPDGASYPDWAPGGDQIAVRLGFENAITILDRSGTTLRVIPLGGRPEDIAYSPAGDILATIYEEFLQLFSSHDGSSIHKMRLPGKGNVLGFSHDGRFLAYGGQFGRIGVMELSSYAVKRQLECHSDPKALQFSPDDSTLASAHEDSSIRLWDLETGSLRRTLGNERPVHDIQFSPDGRTLLSASIDYAIRLWSVKYGRSFGVLHSGDSRVPHHGDARLSLSKDGRRLAVCIRREEAQPVVLIQQLSTDLESED
jgi:WD40 repeat protein